jgi:hypothetical protein
MSEEKRRFTRIPFRVTAELAVNMINYSVPEISNLSIGGCVLPVAADLAPATACEVKIVLGGESSELTVRVGGEIVRSDQTTVAIKFTRIDPDSLYHLQNIVRYNVDDVEKVEREIQRHPGLV